ncbi:MAG: GNAT family protein [Anaerolineales bacterium]|nr:GNAT family N-acetyltransferase [Anaerolineales bacterium]
MIYGDRIRLRHVERDDLPQFVEWLNDSRVARGLSIHIPLSMDEEERWYGQMLKSPNEERPLCIEAKQEDGWRLIGNSGFFSIDWRCRSGEFGIFIGDTAIWDQGYGTEVVRLILQHGFCTLNLHRIFLRVFADNLRAIRVYEKVGFIHEGRQRQAEYHDGQFCDVIFMSMLRPEWDEQEEE